MDFTLRDWLNSVLERELADNGLSILELSNDALTVTHADGGQVMLLSEDADTENPRDLPEILITRIESHSMDRNWYMVFSPGVARDLLLRSIRNAVEMNRLANTDQSQRRTLQRKDYVLRELIEIGKHLNAYTQLDELLRVILEKSRHLIGADAGSIFVVEGDEEEMKNCSLRFKLMQNDSVACTGDEFVMPISERSIAGSSVLMKRSIHIPDVAKIPSDAPYQFDSSWDQKTGYITRSILAVPLINQEGTVMGVVQLINRKRNPSVKLLSRDDFDREVIPMDADGRELVETLASQAGVAMENTRLYGEIRNIFAGFIKASVHAIEQRDPTTSGHSFRVAALTRELARVVSLEKDGRFKDVTFCEEALREIETAALLHDFGKVGVREEVLLKAKKLYPQNLEVIRARIDFIRTAIENDHLQRRMLMMEEGTPVEELSILDQARKRAISDIDECWRIINTANEPTVLAEGDFAKVEDVAGRIFFDINGVRRHYLESEEVNALMVAKGSLTKEEMEEIRSHVTHTISFLERIPWGRAFRNIPRFAGCHHEKLDGSGYPHRLTESDIPLPSRIMAVADIYDALTAADRPYKKAVPLDKALMILEYEVKDRHIDGDLVALFRKHEIYRVIEGKNPGDLVSL